MRLISCREILGVLCILSLSDRACRPGHRIRMAMYIMRTCPRRSYTVVLWYIRLTPKTMRMSGLLIRAVSWGCDVLIMTLTR